MKPRPRGHEIDVAEVLVEYFGVDVEFVKTSERKTPDFLIDGLLWELRIRRAKVKITSSDSCNMPLTNPKM